MIPTAAAADKPSGGGPVEGEPIAPKAGGVPPPTPAAVRPASSLASLPSMAVGRNDPCPCGSGRKYKRCCLEQRGALARRRRALLGTLDELAGLAYDLYPVECETGFRGYYEGGIAAFGLFGAAPRFVERAQAWFLFDPELAPGRRSLLDAVGPQLTPGLASEPLAASQLRLWRIEAARGAESVEVTCPLTGEHSLLGGLRPDELPAPGELTIGRTVPASDGPALIFGAVDVLGEVEDELLVHARRRWAEAGDRARFWSSCGGELSRLASSWPEQRYCTPEGDLWATATATYESAAPALAAERFSADPEFEERPEEAYDERERCWAWLAPMPPRASTPPQEPGVRYLVDHEDGPTASFDLDPAAGLVRLWAATPARFDAAEARLRSSLGKSLGRRVEHQVESPDSEPRWQRERLELLAPPSQDDVELDLPRAA